MTTYGMEASSSWEAVSLKNMSNRNVTPVQQEAFQSVRTGLWDSHVSTLHLSVSRLSWELDAGTIHYSISDCSIWSKLASIKNLLGHNECQNSKANDDSRYLCRWGGQEKKRGVDRRNDVKLKKFKSHAPSALASYKLYLLPACLIIKVDCEAVFLHT